MPKPGCKTVDLRMPSELGYEKVAMNAAAALAESMGFSADRIEDLRTAVSEACVNAMEHGNQGRARIKVTVTLRVDANELRVAIRDRGTGAVLPAPAPVIEDQLADSGHTRGWGMFLIESLVDEVRYEQEARGGNTVHLAFRLASGQVAEC